MNTYYIPQEDLNIATLGHFLEDDGADDRLDPGWGKLPDQLDCNWGTRICATRKNKKYDQLYSIPSNWNVAQILISVYTW